jgi:hypothetical protein
MATWKKVIVSGSNISQLANDAGYLTSVTAANTFATMSVNGVSVIADSSIDTLTIASSSGAGLNIVGDAGADSITFTLGGIPNSSLANSTISGKALGTNLDNHSAGAGLNGSAYNGSAAQTWSVNSGSMLPYYSGSIFSTVSGNITISATGVATIANDSVALGTKTTGNYVQDVTAGAGLTKSSAASEGQTVDLAVGAGTHITVNADDVAVNTTTLTPVIWAASGSYTGSIFTGITGDVTINAGGVSNITAGVITNNDVNASAGIVYTKLSFAGSNFVSSSVLSSSGQGQVTGSINGVNQSITVTDLGTTGNPTFASLTLTGDAAVNGGDITTTAATATIFNANATTINLGSAATTLNLGAGSGNTTVNNNLVVTGDLTVNGTTTTVNTTNVLVEDKFILLASGSTAGTDGGIIVQNAVAGTGFAFGYDTADDRWVFQDALAGTATSFGTVTAYATTTQYGTAGTKPNDATGPAYGGASTGYGNMWVSTDTGEIWIYS